MRLMSVMSHAALPAPGVSVRDEGSAVAGSNYSLFCEVTIPPLLSDMITVPSSSVTWTHPSGEVQHAFGNSVQLIFSPLTINDEGTYNCTAYYHVGGVPSLSTSVFHHVSVGKSYFYSRAVKHCMHVLIFIIPYLEPVNPINPEYVMLKNVTTESAIIQWTVSYISYSPETYVVKYGTSQDTLIQNSSTIYSGDDITITDMTYSVKLSNLKENTTYYVQVVATNTALRSSMSIVVQFRTSLHVMKAEAGIHADQV